MKGMKKVMGKNSTSVFSEVFPLKCLPLSLIGSMLVLSIKVEINPLGS